jgi:hypothetical protein
MQSPPPHVAGFNLALVAVAAVSLALLVTAASVSLLLSSTAPARATRPRPPWPRSALAAQGCLFAWWAYDAVWHLRRSVCTPAFERRLVDALARQEPTGVQKMLRSTEIIWRHHPVAWSGLVITGDMTVMALLLWSIASRQRWLMRVVAWWAVLRWMIAGFGGVLAASLFGPAPGAFALAAMTAGVLAQRRIRFGATLRAVWLLWAIGLSIKACWLIPSVNFWHLAVWQVSALVAMALPADRQQRFTVWVGLVLGGWLWVWGPAHWGWHADHGGLNAAAGLWLVALALVAGLERLAPNAP